MTDDRERERLRWRCRRGLLELDLMLEQAFAQHYDTLTPAERVVLATLLALEDTTLFSYMQGRENPPDSELSQLVRKLRQ
jgi:antitoxin CptB